MPESNGTTSATSTNAAADPARHKALERRVHDHVGSLLEERRFVVPTTFGPRSLPTLQRDVEHWDRGLAVKEQMLALDKPDFELQDKLPVGRGFDVVRSWTTSNEGEQIAVDGSDAESVALAAEAAVGSARFRVESSSTLVRVSACTAHLIRRGRGGYLLDVGVAQPDHAAGRRKLEQRPLRDA